MMTRRRKGTMTMTRVGEVENGDHNEDTTMRKRSFQDQNRILDLVQIHRFLLFFSALLLWLSQIKRRDTATVQHRELSVGKINGEFASLEVHGTPAYCLDQLLLSHHHCPSSDWQILGIQYTYMSCNPPRNHSASQFDPPNSSFRTHPPDNLLIDLSDDNNNADTAPITNVGVKGMARMFENSAVATPPTENRGSKIPPQKNAAEADSGVVTEHLLPVNRLSRMFDHPSSSAAASPVQTRELSLTVHRARPATPGSIGAVRTNTSSYSVPGVNANKMDPSASTVVGSFRAHGRPPPPPPPSKPSYLSANASGNSRRISVVSDPGSFGSPHDEESPSPWGDTLRKDRNISQSQPINPFGDHERTGNSNGRSTSRPVSAYIEPQNDESTQKMSISDRIAAFQSIRIPQNPGLKPPASNVRSTSPSIRFNPAAKSPSYSQRPPPPPPPASKSSKPPTPTAALRIPSNSDRGSSDDDQQPQPLSTTPRAQRTTFPLRLPLPISSSSARSSVADDSTPTTTTTPTAFQPLSPPISASGRSPLPYSPSRFPALSNDDTEDTLSVATTMSGTVSMTEEERRAVRDEKRRKVLDELATTERTFWNDMEVLREAYYIPAMETQKLSQQDIKILFANLDQVIELARAMAMTLETSIEVSDYVGPVFLKMMPRIEETYGEYCRQNEAAVVRLGELASPDCPQDVRDFLKSCQLMLVGRTQAWDLPSLVIKPVQRVLKYPLLIRELIKYTDPSHPDFENLVTVAQQIEKVAEKINELKKRKDLVDKYIADKTKTNLIHGVTKKVNRGVQGLKQATGIAGGQTTVDSEYSDLADTFQRTWDAIKIFKRLVEEDWLRNLKNAVDYQSEIGAEVIAIYSVGSGSSALGPRKSRSDSIASDAASHPAAASSVLRVTEYSEALSRLGMLPWREAETRVKASLCSTIDNLLMLFEHPSKLMKKRNQKQLDFDRYRTLVPNALTAAGKLAPPPVASGDDVKTLFESADMFPSLNAQLIEELPQFLKLARIAMMGIVNELADIQREAFAQVLHGVQAAGRIVGDGAAGWFPAAYVEDR
ncbi:hypothetical protein BJ742DRAFT_220394 [Cladochytrium replicatum]|nr:hypothetical protein BJ742DRAFT_220394 [Cladochytrium replicatum]